MLILILSSGSILAFALGILGNLRNLRAIYREEFGPLSFGCVVVAWSGVCLVPALGAAGLVVARYDELDAFTRLLGLAPPVLLLLVILSVVASVIRHIRRT
jgi:hypothetical protein